MSAVEPLYNDHDLLAPPPRLEPLALLLIEDSPSDSRLLQEQLREPIQRGEVMLQVVRRLSDAVTALKRLKYACALVDLGLPDGHGIDSLAALRKIDPDVALIVLTGHDSDALAQQIMALGVEDYLVKGRDDGGLLLRRIRFAVQHHRREGRGNGGTVDAGASFGRDPVSGLPNRALFEDRAVCALAQAESGGAGVSLLSIGIDGIPDDAADMRQRIGAAMTSTLRNSDTVAMLADGEYAVLLAPTDARFDALAVARRLEETLRAIDTADGPALCPHIGIARHPRDGLTAAALQEHAEQAMFRAQRIGAGICPYQDPDAATMAETVSTAEVWTGAPLERLELRYQPWFDVRTGLPLGVEARWSSDDQMVWRGAGPALRREAGIAMIAAALARLRHWRGNGTHVPLLAVPLDAACLEQPDLLATLEQALQQQDLQPSDLQLLVDAAVVATASAERMSCLRQLRDSGFGLTLVDFQVTADSLGTLMAIELDAVRHAPEPPVTERLDRKDLALIGAAAGLGLDLIATGVDDPAVRDRLTAAGMRYLQGDAVCPALHAAELPLVWQSARAA